MTIAVTTGASMPASYEVVQVMEIELEELNYDEEKDQDQGAEED